MDICIYFVSTIMNYHQILSMLFILSRNTMKFVFDHEECFAHCTVLRSR